MRPSELKELDATFRELSRSCGESGNVLRGVADTVRTLKRLIGEPNAGGKAKGSRLIAAGMASIAFPDPTISDLVGAALIAAGLIKNKMAQLTVVDVYREFQDTIRRVANTMRELTYVLHLFV